VTTHLDAKVPSGPIEDKWDEHRFDLPLISPANRSRFEVIVVGTGVAGASLAATLGELGYRVKVFTYHDSCRRAHSVAAQGGINAAKNYRGDGDSIFRLFYDTIKGGDFRSREADVYRLAQVSLEVIDQCVAQGVPFAREYGGLLANRSFGGVQVSRTFYARSATGQQLLLGSYQALARQVAAGTVELHTRTEMLDLVMVDGRAAGVVVRDLVSGEISSHSAHAVVLATGGYCNVYYLSTNAKANNASAIWRAHLKGARLANPCFTQIHPTSVPADHEFRSKMTLMSESLRNDGRVWVPQQSGDKRAPDQIPAGERDYYLERRYPAFGNLVPRDVASRAAKKMIDEGCGVGPLANSVYLDFADAIERVGRKTIEERYGNVFDMYQRITGENPYEGPMRIAPTPHFSMGGLWVDYNLETTVPGLFAIGEANFSDHGANRLGANSLLQGLTDGYFVLPRTITSHLAPLLGTEPVPSDHPAFGEAETVARERVRRLLATKGSRTVEWFHRELGRTMIDCCGMTRHAEGLRQGIVEIQALREGFREDVLVPGDGESLNQSLEKAGRVSDFFELAELMCRDALHREESCGAHFRQEHQTGDGEPLRNDDDFSYVAAWGSEEGAAEPSLAKEPLEFSYVEPTRRSYR
jgi:succinate dehydrogenase / fumarate reductase flavoprotein subunit